MLFFKKTLSAILASLMLLSSATVLAGCAKGDENTNTPSDTTAPIDEETGEVDHRFDGVNFGGREFRIYTSAHGGSLSSNKLIEGQPDLAAGDMVNDAVLRRNIIVEELLGVELVFTQCDLGYGAIAGDIRTFTQSGGDEFDLVINDNYDFSTLLIEGNFRNVMDNDCVFDFDRNYWYADYMADLRLQDDYQYLLAGVYFIDVLRTAHILILNKDIYKDYYHSSADAVYDMVNDYKWTYDKLISLTTNVYIDKNNDGSKNSGDQFGYVDYGFWGASIAYSASGTTNFITRDEEGVPIITIHEGDRSNSLAEAMTNLFNDQATLMDTDPLAVFAKSQTLVSGGLFLRHLEDPSLRGMESDAAVLPLPMLFESDKKYVTATHDTTELGAILITSTDMEYISTVIEVLNRETANVVIPKYYKESIQVQCVDDEKASAMIDIVTITSTTPSFWPTTPLWATAFCKPSTSVRRTSVSSLPPSPQARPVPPTSPWRTSSESSAETTTPNNRKAPERAVSQLVRPPF